jgi:hypothetical protein
VLELAAAEERIIVTRNSRDFAPLAREWAEAQRQHVGMILIWTLDHSQFGEIVAGYRGPSRSLALPRAMVRPRGRDLTLRTPIAT